jgi:hypothetical protein
MGVQELKGLEYTFPPNVNSGLQQQLNKLNLVSLLHKGQQETVLGRELIQMKCLQQKVD